ncbi:hypothetical protein C8R45DRAFT_766575, partial [Mycena sanguinolenta]
AIYDSGESFPQPRCNPGTRTQILKDIREWGLKEGVQQIIMWLHGPAGAGKFAIMQTLTRQLRD